MAEVLDELAAQLEDREKAAKEVEEAPAPPAPWTEIRQHFGVGPLAYETHRGLVKVHSGEFICTFEYPVLQADGVTTVMEKETIILKAEALEALKPPPTDLPYALEVRAGKIGDARRGTKPAPKPVRPSNELPEPPKARPKA